LADVIAKKDAEKLLASAQTVLGEEMLGSLSCPLFVAPPTEWSSSRHKLLVVGQETFGWDFPKGEIGSDEDVWTLKECLDIPGAIEALGAAYEKFDLGHQFESLSRAPFWNAHRYLAERLEDGEYRAVLWTNLARCDASPINDERASVWTNFSYENLDLLCAWQKEFAVTEIADSEAKAVIFFTGPNYDYLLERTFRDVQYFPVAGNHESERVLARIESPDLPAASFRTYHPKYLRISGQWDILDTLAETVGSA